MKRPLQMALIALGCASLSALQGCAVVVAGAAAGAVVATDRRSSAVQLDDQTIELKGSARLREQLPASAKVDLTSFNHKVLLTGYVGDEAAKTEVERVMRAVPGVTRMYNEIIVGNPASNTQYVDDAYISTKVKARLLERSQQLYANHIKVVTEAGSVYLLGLVRPDEADIAADVASGTSGVKRVVKLFEYIN
ncbi:MAG: BON domain-containing protein [Chitinivorax sp.]